MPITFEQNEANFLVNLLKKLSINPSDVEAKEVVSLVQSILAKIQAPVILEEGK